ncbi:putative lysine-specific histone demethylase 1-like protein 3 [Iris pallida]|uniref:alpha-L-fucosidase n=1 Tax=Iris pallida TaxID=29817 RepID=A0AAX6I9L9_IRIPA|nr:putative lysine-specific histone demethylase 1-like protein 3 [Iris pallida]
MSPATAPAVLLLLLSIWFHGTSSRSPVPPPLPIPPLPSSSQLRWQLTEMSLFLHFGTNTFTDREWGTGRADPSLFDPTSLSALQWARAAKSNGFGRLLLTAKHHDGFCLWPSDYTDYSVASSPWRDGKGDIVTELAEAAREVGVGLGLYLSPWDRHEGCYGNTEEYNEFYLGQMTELLTRYGDIQEVWLDGAKGEDEKEMVYFFDCWFEFIHQLQPHAVIFSDGGPDTRWVGDEAGVAGTTCWSLFNQSSLMIGHTDDKYSSEGDPHGRDWVPAECDVSIRPGWFWHSSEQPKSAITLLDIYYKSVGRNCLLLLNVPPNSSGLISDEDLQVLQEFTAVRQTIFSHNLAQNATVTASSTRGGVSDPRFTPSNIFQEGIYTYWAPDVHQTDWVIFLDLGQSIPFNVMQLQEPIQMGQRVIEFHLDILEDEEWTTIVTGTTIGYKRLLQFTMVKVQFLRLTIDESRADPLISFLGIYLDPFSIAQVISNASARSSFNNSQVIERSSFNDSQVIELKLMMPLSTANASVAAI